ncbi:MAG TPA: transcription termination factor NusA [Armatimonadota bacterium]|nr:transcription termination factor NusA [Armatimonadota bacterium]
MSEDLNEMLQQVCREKDLPYDVIVGAVERALVQAFKRNYTAPGLIVVEFGHRKIRVVSQRRVVAQIENVEEEILHTDAIKLKKSLTVGDVYEEDVTPRDFSRIAAMMARQVLVQSLKDAEREHVYDDFSAIVGEIRSGVVQRKDGRNVVVTLERTEALLPPSEQVPNEPYRFGDRIKVYILEARRTSRGPQVIVSRTHFRLVARLFELEVPEVHDGVVELKAIAREPGARTKIAVASRDERVDAVGACVGHRGGRVQAIVNELYGERIDIIAWNTDIAQFITSSLQPAKVSVVEPDLENKAAVVIVPDHQLSLAIGKHGQNVRLAARLTGWRIDIKSELKIREEQVVSQQHLVREAVSRQLSAKHYEPWGWVGAGQTSSQPAGSTGAAIVPSFDAGVFGVPWAR